MNSYKNIRWKQRFQNFEAAFLLLKEAIQSIVGTYYKEIEQAMIFGSRALGSEKKGSDIDLAISGKNISTMTVDRLSRKLNS